MGGGGDETTVDEREVYPELRCREEERERRGDERTDGWSVRRDEEDEEELWCELWLWPPPP